MSEISNKDEAAKGPRTLQPNEEPASLCSKFWHFVRRWGFIGTAALLPLGYYWGRVQNTVVAPWFVAIFSCVLVCISAHNIFVNSHWLKRFALPVFICLFILGGTHLMSKIPEPRSNDSKPDLVPTLVIDSVSETDVEYRYEVLNSGKSPAYNIRHGDSGEGSQSTRLEFSPGSRFAETELRPGERKNISLMPYTWTREQPFFQKVLSLSWTDERTNQFHRTFTFQGRNAALRPGTIFQFEHSSHDKLTEDPDESFIEHLNRPYGTLMFSFVDANQTGAGKFLQTTNRFLDINLGKRVVSFWNLNASNKMETLRLEIKTNNPNHTLMLVWNSNGCSMRLDDEEVTSEGFPK